MFGKIENGRLVIAGQIIKTEKGFISNPTTEQLIELGYKEIEYTERPSFDKEEEKLKEVYTDGDKITVGYEIVALTDEEHNEIIKQEIIEEEKKITKRRQREIDLDKEGARDFEQEVENNIIALRAKFREVPQIEE